MNATPPDLPSPVGRYQDLTQVHASATTTIARGHDPRTGRDVWITFLAPEPSGDRAVVDELRSTAGRLAGAPDDRLVPIDELIEHDGRLGVVTPAPAATLADLMSRGDRFPVAQAARIGADVADALAAAHRAGIVHGALSPHAVGEETSGRVVLRDLGFARAPDAIVDRPTWTAYAAPEQLADGTVDERSDLYALGSILYLMLTGRPPFVEFDQTDLARHKLEGAAPSVSRDEPLVPAALDALVTRLLARDPDRRPAAAAEVAGELRRFATSAPATPVTPMTVTTSEAVTENGRRGPQWWWFALAALIIAAAIIAAVLIAKDDGGTKKQVSVPAVVGKQVAVATQALEDRGLTATTVSQSSATVGPGAVIEQSPPAGTIVDRGRVVTLTVSSGPNAAPPIIINPPSRSTSTTSTSTTTSTTTTTTTTPPPPST